MKKKPGWIKNLQQLKPALVIEKAKPKPMSSILYTALTQLCVSKQGNVNIYMNVEFFLLYTY